MMAAWVKALLFVAGGVTAAAGTAYVTGLLDPWLGRAPAMVAALPETPPAQQPQEAPPAASEAVPLPEDPATTEKQDRLVAPSFDLLRVEPNGSVVIAGKGPANATVEAMTGEVVLGATTVGPEGDFVIVLDDPLAPGDYQVVLRATMPDGAVLISSETAVVAIPRTPDGEVLAIVDRPGQPSEIVTLPAAPEEEQDVAAAETAPDEPAAQETEAAQAPEPQPVEEEEVAEAPPAVEEPAEPEAETAEALEPQPAEEEEVAAAEPDAAEEPAAEPETVVEAEEEAPADVVALPEPEEPEAAEPQPAPVYNVVVEAVEIEGDMIYVAGYGEPGRTVRVYAGALLLGDALVSESGRFLIEARRDLPVGEYVIRADLLDADGTVLARAAVPFEREPGESIAAVAVPEPEEPQPAEEEVAVAPEPESAEEEVVVVPAPEPAEEEVAVAPAPAEEEVVAAPEPEPAEEEVVVAPEPEPTEEEVAVAPEPEPAEEEVAVAPEPEPVEEEVAVAPEPEPAEEEVVVAPEPEPAEEEVAVAPAPEPAEEEVVVAPEPEAVEEVETDVALAPPAVEDEPAITAPPLQRVDSAVIIRRGDSLWRISRRVYGRGVRYSTIYLANQDQIRDPNRIWPGQVFAVPHETAEGEQADMDALADQAVAPNEGETAAQ